MIFRMKAKGYVKEHSLISKNNHYFLLISLNLIISLPLFAADRLVPGDYATIQSAIDAAVNGDVVILASGTHSGEGNRDLNTKGKAITLRGTEPDDPAVVAGTVIDCQGSEAEPHRGFSFTSKETTNTVVEGLTIRYGWAVESGGAVSCKNGSSPTFRKCVFEDNVANFYGGAIYCLDASKPTLNECRFVGNMTAATSDGRGGLDGGAVYCMSGSDAAISKCVFDNNNAKSGGAVYCNSSSPAITGCSFTNNYASSKGGAVAMWICHSAVTNCLFAGNSANYVGGAVLIEKDSRASITNCTISGNVTVFYEGGGIAFNGANNPAVKNCILWENLPDEIKIFSGSATVSYSDVKGGWSGTGNLNIDPMFADAANGDFHLKSSAGRWETSSGTWVNDAATSPCVDAGDAAASWSDEPAPSGERVNLGAYGNTAEASKSPGRVTLTAVVDGGNGTVSPRGEYLIGTTVTLRATPNTGYRVLAWSGTDNDPNEGSETNSVTMNEDKTVTVTFEKAPVPTFTLTASVVGSGGTISPQSGTFDINTVAILTATPEHGYRVKAWTGTNNNASTADTNSVTMSENKTVTVEFEEVMYTLTAKVEGGHGTLVSTEEPSLPADTVVSLTAVPDEGYRVKKWTGTDNDESIDANNTVRLDADKTVTVSFEPKNYTLDASVEGGYGTLTASPAGPTVSYDTVVRFTAIPAAGYRVKEWGGTDNDPAAGSNTNSVVVKGDTKVKVKFEAVPEIHFALTAETVNAFGTVEPTNGTYGENEVVTLTARPSAGYRVKAWTGTDDDTSKANTNTAAMTADKHVKVEFERVYSLTASVTGEHGSVSPASGVYLPGETVTLTAVPEAGYRVKAWTGEGIAPQTGSNTIRFTIDRDMDVTVEFEAIPAETCSLTTSVIGGNGSLQPTGGTFDKNSPVTLTAIPDETYRVKAWTGTNNDSSKAATNSVTMTTDKTVSVEFEKIQYNLAVVKTGPGTLDAQVVYEINTVVELNAIPNEGCRLKSWLGSDDDKSTEAANTVTMTRDKTVFVTFEPITYTLTLKAGGEGETQPNGSVTSNPAGSKFNAGTMVELIASPKTGYRVKAWTGTDNDPSTGSKTNRVTMSVDKEIRVEFEPVPPETFTLTTEVPSSYGRVVPSSGTYEAGTTVTLTAMPDAGYKVSSWNGVVSTEETYSVVMDGNRTVSVRFDKIVYRYSLTAAVVGEHGSISPTSETFNEGTKVTLRAVPEAGYRVKEWKGADNVPFTGSNENIVTMTAVKEVTVEFEPIPTQTFATLRVNVTGSGSVSPAGGKYYTGSQVTLVATPEPGHHLKSWAGTDDDTITNRTNTVTLATDKTASVTFEKDVVLSYALTVSVPTGHGTVSPSSGVCLAGSTVRFTAKPETGYRVKSWTGTDNDPNIGGTTNQVKMSSNKTVVVEFESLGGSDLSQVPVSPDETKQAEAVYELIGQAAPMCGAGTAIFVPLCLFFAMVMKLGFYGGEK
jgi:predicted outer membrane repeat protein